MKQGMTLDEANVAWARNADVICPGCESHIDNIKGEFGDGVVLLGAVWHECCAEACKRTEYCASTVEQDYDPQV